MGVNFWLGVVMFLLGIGFLIALGVARYRAEERGKYTSDVSLAVFVATMFSLLITIGGGVMIVAVTGV